MLKTKQIISVEVECYAHEVETVKSSFQKIAKNIEPKNIKILGDKAKPSMNAKIQKFKMML